MERFIPRDKMSPKARRALDARKRVLWTICPAAKRIENKKAYNRHENAALCRASDD
jgi:hypothetical protein